MTGQGGDAKAEIPEHLAFLRLVSKHAAEDFGEAKLAKALWEHAHERYPNYKEPMDFETYGTGVFSYQEEQYAGFLKDSSLTLITKYQDPQGALIVLERFLKLRPDSLGERNNYAACLLGTGQTDKAAKIFKTLLEEYPEDNKLLFNTMQCSLELGRPDEAQAYLDRMLEDADEEALGYILQMGTRLQKDGEIDRAIFIWEAILDKDPKNPQVNKQMGDVYSQKAEVEERRSYQRNILRWKAFRYFEDATHNENQSLIMQKKDTPEERKKKIEHVTVAAYCHEKMGEIAGETKEFSDGMQGEKRVQKEFRRATTLHAYLAKYNREDKNLLQAFRHSQTAFSLLKDYGAKDSVRDIIEREWYMCEVGGIPAEMKRDLF